MKTRSANPGFSVLELLVAAGLAALVIGIATMAPFWQKTSIVSVEKTTMTRDLRNRSLAVTRALHEATAFLYPDHDGSDPVHLLAFLNRSNEILLLYHRPAPDDGLYLYNRTRGTQDPVLDSVQRFDVRRLGRNLVHYQIGSTREEYSFNLQNSVSTCNSLP